MPPHEVAKFVRPTYQKRWPEEAKTKEDLMHIRTIMRAYKKFYPSPTSK